ncbi:MAG: hypothetical protein II881_08905 [Oscillospiraceae bacterium]|nr:hypothetical protein [Oscillospiraceae bacterium]
MKENDKVKKLVQGLKSVRLVALTVATVALITAIPVNAWFFYNRKLAAIIPTDTPISLYINAGHEEDIVYLNLSDIDVERTEDRLDSTGAPLANPKLYKDFVFCVRGEYLERYYLQLAYTTNNQFEYELYNATQQPMDTPHEESFVSFVDTSGKQWEYSKTTGVSISMTKLNEIDNGAEKLGDPAKANEYYSKTYEGYGYTGDAENGSVDKYAVPIYCRTQYAEIGNGNDAFTNYYILRVKWKSDRINDRETDILYIAAGQ